MPVQLVRRAEPVATGRGSRSGGWLERSAWSVVDVVSLGFALGVSLLSLLIGWYGCAHTTTYWRQLLWIVVSGAGLIVGGFGVGVWLLKGMRLQHERAFRLRERAMRLDVVEPVDDRESPSRLGDLVWTTSAMTRYHRAGCALLDGRSATSFPIAQAETKGKRPCGVCAS